MKDFQIEEINNESDVEQKFILPFLIASPPFGLGYSTSDVRTKTDLRQFEIEKGTSKKLYYPDYIIILHGLPILIIEAKHPNETNLDEALREARLYATEINALFPSSFNPCTKILATNAKHTICTLWDSNIIEINLTYTEFEVTNLAYSKFIEFAKKDSLLRIADELQSKYFCKPKFSKPTFLLGGKAVRFEELKLNSFGNTLALEHRHLFNPVTREERDNIVKNAYVVSKRRLRHVDPIDKIIRAAKPPSVTDAHEIETTKKPSEIITRLRSPSKLKNELLLLIGGVGCGKSTFIDFLRNVALPEDIKELTAWVSINMNNAPLSRETIYPWLKKQIIKELQQLHPKDDFYDLLCLEKLYAVELQRVKRGPASYFERGIQQYNKIMSDSLINLQEDLDITLNAYIRYLCAERNKLLVILLDNSDKRNRDDQLLMFDVAKWLQKECSCLVFLPIRDTTYDHHRMEPPLDTVIKDLVFRINAPLFMDVLYKRVEFALREMNRDDKELLSYNLPNGMRVQYPQSEQAFYLACMLRSIFQNDVLFRRIVSGIAGTDIRRGLEIFLDFCKSGHVSEKEILQIRHSRGDYILPKHIVTRVLFRGNRRYYHDSNSMVKNLFVSYPEDVIPDPFNRLAILTWLKLNYRLKGPNGILGYHKISTLISQLVPYGHDSRRIMSEVEALSKAGCIITETQDLINISPDDLISIAPSGHVHLEFLHNLDYIATCSEDVWFSNQSIAQHIADRLIGNIGTGHLTLFSAIQNAEDLLVYLNDYKTKYLANPSSFLSEYNVTNYCDLSNALTNVIRLKDRIDPVEQNKRIELEYPPGSIVDCLITGIKSYGIFAEFGLNASGLIHISEFGQTTNASRLLFEDFDTGDTIQAEIICFKHDHGRFSLRPVD